MEIDMLISEFEAKQEQIENFERHNADVLDAYKKMKEEIDKIQDQIKETVKSSGSDIVTNVFTCQIIKPYKKWIDYELALQNLSIGQIFILNEITETKKEVDFKKFESFVKQDIFPQKALVEAFKEEAQTPRIVFKLNK